MLEFHGVASRRYQHIPLEVQPSLTIDELRQILNWVRNHFLFLTPEEFLKSNKRGVLLTFDDGFLNNFTNALPLLQEFDAPAIFFVTTQHIINPKNWLPSVANIARRHWINETNVPPEIAADLFDGMNQNQLAEAARNPLITIGSHTVSHLFLTKCTKDQLEYELTASRQYLRELTAQPVDLFAYPTGDYDRNVAEAVCSAGYVAAFVEDSRNVGVPLFEIPRIGVYSPESSYLALKLSGLHRRPIRTQLMADGSPME